MANPSSVQTDVVVVGGGVAGLAAAALAARGGLSVTLFERASAVGGRAATHTSQGFQFNVGPHALYARGHARRILGDLGVEFRGHPPNPSGAYAIDQGRKHALPGGFVSLLSTGLLGLPGKVETARLLGSIGRIDAGAIQKQTVREWLDSTIRNADVRGLVQALFRLATYTNSPERQSAGTALEQLQMALAGNVLYLDGGWQVLVDGLRAAATSAGVTIITGMRVTGIDHDDTVRAVRLANGERCPASAVIVAGAPDDAAALLADGAQATLRAWSNDATPVKAACLDVGLSCLPKARATFALGIDQPLYLSVHSAVARLAPEGAATIHVAKYLDPQRDTDAKADERQLEGVLDLVQPGWRDALIERRYLPRMTVSHAVTTAAGGGNAGRPGPAVPGIRNFYVVGDWVGVRGQLADASLASAEQAAGLVVRSAEGRAIAA